MDDGAPIETELYAARTTRGADGVPRRFISTADYLAMFEAGILDPDENLELLEGELVAMNAEHNRHAIWKRRLNRIWTPIIAQTDYEIAIEPTVFVEDGSAPEPDLAIHPLGILPEEVRGEDCLIIVEIADSTIRKDLVLKSRIYARTGVQEYWVLDAHKRVAHLFDKPRPDGSWGRSRLLDDTTLLIPAFMADLAIKLTDLDF